MSMLLDRLICGFLQVNQLNQKLDANLPLFKAKLDEVRQKILIKLIELTFKDGTLGRDD